MLTGGFPRECLKWTHSGGGSMNSRRHPTSLLLLILGLTVLATAARAQQPDSLQALKRLTLDQLMNIEVTSVSRRAERLAQTASAIQVVTQEDIVRSGASSLPEALRLAANLQVAQINSREWAISARGFNSTSANKLLVLIDGRTVYTPLFSVVFWDVQDVLLSDVDRIEVISGPGATLWGANGQWRDQRDHEGRERHGGTPGYGRWRHRAARPGIRPLRRRAR